MYIHIYGIRTHTRMIIQTNTHSYESVYTSCTRAQICYYIPLSSGTLNSNVKKNIHTHAHFVISFCITIARRWRPAHKRTRTRWNLWAAAGTPPRCNMDARSRGMERSSIRAACTPLNIVTGSCIEWNTHVYTYREKGRGRYKKKSEIILIYQINSAVSKLLGRTIFYYYYSCPPLIIQ